MTRARAKTAKPATAAPPARCVASHTPTRRRASGTRARRAARAMAPQGKLKPKPSARAVDAAKGATREASRATESKSAGKRGAMKTTTTTAKGATTASGARGYWQAPEEQALKRAVRKHGIGAWEKMRNDPEFAVLRCARRARDNADARREDGRVGRARRRDASASTERCERWDETRRDETETRGLTKGARERDAYAQVAHGGAIEG